MENLTVKHTAEQLLEKSKEELQTLYAQVIGSEAKAKDTKQQLADVILAKQTETENAAAEKSLELTGDDKIIAENPEATPYELLEKGLTQEGFERLMIAQNDQGDGNKPADKPTIQADAPEVKEVGADYADKVQPVHKTENLIANKRESIQQGTDDDVRRPELIGKVTKLPNQTVAQAMNAGVQRKGVNLDKHTNKQGGVKIQKGNGQTEIVSKATAERLVKLDPGVYKILS